MKEQMLKPSLLACTAALLFGFSASSSADLINGRALCDVLDVKVTNLSKQDGTLSMDLDPAQSASACLGAYSGNDSVSGLGNNLGLKDVGFLNDTSLFPQYGAFVDQADLQDIGTQGVFEDPGWIFVQKVEFADNGDTTTELGTITREDLYYTFDDNLLSVGVDDGTTSGSFTYKPPVNNPQVLLDILGADKFFDQVAVVFKASDQFAIYNFKLSDFGLPPILGTTDANYMFSGVWDMSTTLFNNAGGAAGISHISLWLRDPSAPNVTQVPTPSTMILLLIGFLLLMFYRVSGSTN